MYGHHVQVILLSKIVMQLINAFERIRRIHVVQLDQYIAQLEGKLGRRVGHYVIYIKIVLQLGGVLAQAEAESSARILW